MNFFDGIEVVFGTLQASAEVSVGSSRCYENSETVLVAWYSIHSLPPPPHSWKVLSPNAIAVKTPISPRAGEVDITLVFKTSQFCINSPGKFLYMGM